jgi:hypothetical protein
MPALQNQAVAHVRFEGRSLDIEIERLGVEINSPDRAVRAALARYLEVSAAKLDAYVLDRHANGNLTLRPEAVFG